MSDNARENRIRKAMDKEFFGIGKEQENVQEDERSIEEKVAAPEPPRCCGYHDLAWLCYRMMTQGVLPPLPQEVVRDMGKALFLTLKEEGGRREPSPLEVLENMAPEQEGDMLVIGGEGTNDPEVLRALVESLRSMGADKLANAVAKSAGLEVATSDAKLEAMSIPELEKLAKTLTMADGATAEVVENGLVLTKGVRSVLLHPTEVVELLGGLTGYFVVAGGPNSPILGSVRQAGVVAVKKLDKVVTVLNRKREQEGGGK